MMLYPSIDKLLEEVPSSYKLIILASKRAHELHDKAPGYIEEYQSVTDVGRALEEIADGYVTIEE